MFPETKATQVHSFNKELSTSEGMAEAQRASHVSRGFPAGSFVELRNSFPSYVEIVPPFMDQLMRFISKFREDDETNSDIELAVREAIANGIYLPTKRRAYTRGGDRRPILEMLMVAIDIS